MNKIMVVMLAYFLMFKADLFIEEYYYFYTSFAYSVIGIISCLLPSSRLLMTYATVNLFAAITALALQYDYYAVKSVVFSSVLNINLIIESVEMALIASGVFGAGVFISNKLRFHMRGFEPCSTGLA